MDDVCSYEPRIVLESKPNRWFSYNGHLSTPFVPPIEESSDSGFEDFSVGSFVGLVASITRRDLKRFLITVHARKVWTGPTQYQGLSSAGIRDC